MTENQQKYFYSKQVQERSRKMVIAICWSMPLLAMIFVFGSTNNAQLPTSIKLVVGGLTTLMGIFAAWLGYKLGSVNRKKTYVTLDDDGIHWHGSYGSRKVLYSDINGIDVKRSKKEENEIIALKALTGPGPVGTR